ncbi:MAG: T9SS type A sorting domain-containing protein [Bacteroidota bacterium]
MQTVTFFDNNCFPQYAQSVYIPNGFFPYVTGLNTGFKIIHNLPQGSLSTQAGVVNSGDTLPLNPTVTGYDFYFASAGGVMLHWIVYGIPTAGGESYLCAPWSAVWGTALCTNPGYFISAGNCTVGVMPGIKEENVSSFSVFPNPASGMVTVSAQEPIGAIEISDVSGRLIVESPAGGFVIKIDLSAADKGIYLIKVFGREGNCSVSKIMLL